MRNTTTTSRPRRIIALAVGGALALAPLAATSPASAGPEGYTLATSWDAAANEDVAAAPDGTLWSVDGGTTVNHFSPSGTLLGAFTLSGVTHARSIAVGPDGKLYITDSNGTTPSVVAVDPTGVALAGYTLTDEAYALGVDIASTGEVLVTNASTDRVEVFAPDGTWLRNLGSSGAGPGQLDRPDDVVVGGATVFVSDYSNDRIQKFDLATGAYLGGWGQPGRGPGQLDKPYAVDLTPAGNVVVFDNYALQEFTPAGALVSRTDHGLTLLFDNQGMSIDTAGSIYTTNLKGLARFTPTVPLSPPPGPPPPGPQPPQTGTVALAKRTIAVTGKRAALTLSCTGGAACRGTVKVTAATKPAKKKLTVIRGKYAIDAGRETVQLTLTKKARTLLKRRSTVSVKVALTPATGAGARTAKATLVRARKR